MNKTWQPAKRISDEGLQFRSGQVNSIRKSSLRGERLQKIWANINRTESSHKLSSNIMSNKKSSKLTSSMK